MIETQKIKLFDVLEDMRKAFPGFADNLGKDFNDDTQLVRKAAPSETLEAQPDGVIIGKITTLAVDTYNEVVLPEGMDKTRYDKNNVEAADNFGVFVGTGIDIVDSVKAAVEASFIDENSVSGSVSVRF